MGNAGICPKCKGRGEIWIGYPPRVPCPKCKGTGTLQPKTTGTTARDLRNLTKE